MASLENIWPDDLAGLAAIHFDSTEPIQRRAEAWCRMEPKIQCLARRIMQARFPGLRRPLRDDLIEESPNDVALKHPEYDRTRPYGPWCRVVLEHRFADARKKKRAGPFPFLPADEDASYEGQIPERSPSPLARFFATPLPEADLRLLRSWEPDVRQVFLLKSCLWTKLPDRERAEWLGHLPLSDLADAADGTLAQACGMNLPAFRNIWSRYHHCWYLLQALAEVIDFPEPGPSFFPQLYAEARRRYRCLDGQTAIEFPPDEVQLLAQRRPQEKFAGNMLLLSVSGLYPRVPNESWNQWVDGDGLERPFPPPGFRSDEDEQRKLEQLGPVFGTTVGSLATRWTQYCRKLLEDLRSIGKLIVLNSPTQGSEA
jgi:hypothetical protein